MSSNDWTSPDEASDRHTNGADGWVETTSEEARGPEPFADLDDEDRPPAPRPSTDSSEEPTSAPEATPAEWKDAQTMAVLAHMSILFGVPVFLVPMLMRNDPLSVHHSKAAAVTFSLFYLTLGLTFLTCGLVMPLVVLAYVPALIGVSRAAQGREAGEWGFGHFGERLFPTLEAESDA